MMSLWDALRMNMMISYQELVRTFPKWYFYQLLKDYEGEQLYLNELGYVYGNEEKTNEIVKNNPGYVVKIFEEKMVNELKIRTRMMKILRKIYV